MKSDEKYFWILVSIIIGIMIFNYDYSKEIDSNNVIVEEELPIDAVDYSIFPEEGGRGS